MTPKLTQVHIKALLLIKGMHMASPSGRAAAVLPTEWQND